MENQHYIKQYVEVVVRWHDDGRIVPLTVIWPDGRSFRIDEVVGDPIRRATRKVGGNGMRYTIKINGKTRYLYLEDDGQSIIDTRARWYVELIVPMSGSEEAEGHTFGKS